jgi:hypothetical protein
LDHLVPGPFIEIGVVLGHFVFHLVGFGALVLSLGRHTSVGLVHDDPAQLTRGFGDRHRRRCIVGWGPLAGLINKHAEEI